MGELKQKRGDAQARRALAIPDICRNGIVAAPAWVIAAIPAASRTSASQSMHFRAILHVENSCAERGADASAVGGFRNAPKARLPDPTGVGRRPTPGYLKEKKKP